MATSRRKPNQQSEPITPQEIIANEPIVKETTDVSSESSIDAEGERTPIDITDALFTKAESIAALESAELDRAMESPIPAQQSAKEILEKAGIEPAAGTITTADVAQVISDLKKAEGPTEFQVIHTATGDVQTVVRPAPTEEEKILSFLDGKTGFVRINELLKSIYGVPSFNVPAQWLQQGESRRLKGVLQRLVDAGKIEVKNNAHQTLGNFYYGEDTKQKHRNLNDTIIEAATKK